MRDVTRRWRQIHWLTRRALWLGLRSPETTAEAIASVEYARHIQRFGTMLIRVLTPALGWVVGALVVGLVLLGQSPEAVLPLAISGGIVFALAGWGVASRLARRLEDRAEIVLVRRRKDS